MRSYEYRHVVGLEETNLVGNVYFVNHLRWQGRCREFFLRDHAPGLLASLGQDLTLVTTHVSCDFLEEVSAFDEIVVRMTLAAVAGHRVSMRFEYWRTGSAGGERLVARGTQEIACMQRSAGQLRAVPLPLSFTQALVPFA